MYISHPQSPKITSDYKFVASADKSEPDFWVAKVLEVRASDQQHVYLRVFWLYWPDELPGGRKDYHGQNEVLMSNHMDIIDAMTVSGGADVRMWHERDEDEDLGSIFFRQFFNLTTKEPLSVSVSLPHVTNRHLCSLLGIETALYMQSILQSRYYSA